VTDAALGVGLAVSVALLVGVLHPVSRPWVLEAGRWLIAGLAAALAVTALVALSRRPKGGPRGPVTPREPVAPDPVLVARSYTRRIEADKAHNELLSKADELVQADDVDGLAEMEAELRARAGLPPVF
jgi:hypothetical protein